MDHSPEMTGCFVTSRAPHAAFIAQLDGLRCFTWASVHSGPEGTTPKASWGGTELPAVEDVPS